MHAGSGVERSFSIAITYELQIFNVFLLKYTLQTQQNEAPVLLQFSLWVIVSIGFCSLPFYSKQYGRLANIMVTWKALWRVETFEKVLKLKFFFFWEQIFSVTLSKNFALFYWKTVFLNIFNHLSKEGKNLSSASLISNIFFSYRGKFHGISLHNHTVHMPKIKQISIE